MILKDESVPRNSWKLARVEATYPDADAVAVADQSQQSSFISGVRYFSTHFYFCSRVLNNAAHSRAQLSRRPRKILYMYVFIQ